MTRRSTGRARHRGPARRPRRRMLDADRRLRQGAPAVRRADRQLPGGQAPPRRRPARPRVRAPARLPRRVVARRRATPTRPVARVDGQGATPSDAATLAAPPALQCHGAIGYTVEYDLHLYMKRAWALAADVGRRRPAHRGPRPAPCDPVTASDERGTTMAEAYIIDAVRTPVGKRGGGLSQVHPADLGRAPAHGAGRAHRRRPGRGRGRRLRLRRHASVRRPATSPAPAGSPPACPTRCRAPPSTASAARPSRPCTSRRRPS